MRREINLLVAHAGSEWARLPTDGDMVVVTRWGKPAFLVSEAWVVRLPDADEPGPGGVSSMSPDDMERRLLAVVGR